MDRQITPLLTEPQKILLLQPDKVMLEDTPVYIFNTGTQDVIRIELIFDAGSRFPRQWGRRRPPGPGPP